MVESRCDRRVSASHFSSHFYIDQNTTAFKKKIFTRYETREREIEKEEHTTGYTKKDQGTRLNFFWLYFKVGVVLGHAAALFWADGSQAARRAPLVLGHAQAKAKTTSSCPLALELSVKP
jgi:hypothetical protein